MTALVVLAGCSPSTDDAADTAQSKSLFRQAVETYEMSINEEAAAALERQIALCMQASGFEYAPAPVLGGQLSERSLDLGSDRTEAEFVDAYGFGISTTYDFTTEPPTDEELERLTSSIGSRRTNADILNEMPESEQTAWFVTLTGATPDGELAASANEVSCEAQARESTQEHSVRLANFEELLFGQLSERLRSDSRVLAAHTEQQGCITAMGYPFDSPESARSHSEMRFTEFLDEVHATSGEQSITIQVSDTQSLEVALNPDLTSAQTNQLAKIQDEEISIARQVLVCEELAGLTELMDEIEDEIGAEHETLLRSVVNER